MVPEEPQVTHPPRTEQGAALRADLEAIKARVFSESLTIPPGKTLAVGVAIQHADGTVSGEIGAAWLKGKWRVNGNVTLAVQQGKTVVATGIYFTR